jgi:hypothetical protein
MSWIRLEENLDLDPRVMRLDGFGMTAFITALRLAKAKEGVLSADSWDPWYIARRANFSGFEDQIEKGMGRVLELGLVALDEETGEYVIPGWSSYHPPKEDNTNAERQRRYKAKRREKKGNGVTEGNATVTPGNAKVTGGNAGNALRDVTVRDDTVRKEEGEGRERAPARNLVQDGSEKTQGATQKLHTKMKQTRPRAIEPADWGDLRPEAQAILDAILATHWGSKVDPMQAPKCALEWSKQFPSLDVVGVIQEAAKTDEMNGRQVYPSRAMGHLYNWLKNEAEKQAKEKAHQAQKEARAKGTPEVLPTYKRLKRLANQISAGQGLDMVRISQLVATARADGEELPPAVRQFLEKAARAGTISVENGKIVGWDQSTGVPGDYTTKRETVDEDTRAAITAGLGWRQKKEGDE